MRSFHILYIDMNMILRYLAAILLAVLPAVCTEAVGLMLKVLRWGEDVRWKYKVTVTG